MNNTLGRRDLLAAAGSVLICSTRIPAAEKLAPISFAVVTDTHLGRKDNLAAERNWKKAILEINESPSQFVLHLGDVVDQGREEQYTVYQKSLALLKKPIHEIPGNHDSPKLFAKHVVEKTDRSVDYGKVRFVLCNNSRRDSHDGFISKTQIDWLKTTFENSRKEKRKIVVCCHVPIHSNKHPDRGWYVKPDNGQAEIYKILKEYSDIVIASFHGHFHNGIRGWQDNEWVECLMPSVCYNQNRNLKKHLADGTAKGFFVDELRPGFVLAELGNGLLTMRYKPLGNPVNGQWKSTFNADEKK